MVRTVAERCDKPRAGAAAQAVARQRQCRRLGARSVVTVLAIAQLCLLTPPGWDGRRVGPYKALGRLVVSAVGLSWV